MADLFELMNEIRDCQEESPHALPRDCVTAATLDAVLRGCLKAYPADDQTLVTGAWMESVGGKRVQDTSYAINTGAVLVIVNSLTHTLHLGVGAKVAGKMSAISIPIISGECCRGDVRRLCAAIGYELDG